MSGAAGPATAAIPMPRGGRGPDSYPAAVPTIGMTVYGCDGDEAVLFEEMAPRLGVTPTITTAALGEDNVGLARGNRCISVGHKARIAEPTLLALSRAGVTHISTRSIGHDHLDLDYAAGVGISVTNVAYSPDGVADYTLMLILMALRGARSMIRRTDLHDYRLDAAPGKELRDLTVGVVGTGRIGTAVIERLRGFGCRLLAHDRTPEGAVEAMTLDELLRRSDVVTLHAPLDADTRHLLDRGRIALMRPGAYLVNTGRGALVDTEALVEALESGALAGAALDVVEGEEGVFYADRRHRPPRPGPLVRLQAMPNVIVSPHTAYYTDHALGEMVENSILECLRFERGRRDA